MEQSNSLTKLRIFSRTDEFPEKVLDIPLSDPPDFYTMETELEVEFPGGHKLLVYAEVGLEPPDVSLSIEEGGRSVDLRCSSGVVVSYTASWNEDILFQIGTGPWE